MKAFKEILPKLLNEFVGKVLLMYAEEYMQQKEKPFECCKCGNKGEFIWKTRHGEERKVLTIFEEIILKQIQVECKRCGHITRKLLGLKEGEGICKEARRKLGLIGALASFRASEEMFGWRIEEMTIWR